MSNEQRVVSFGNSLAPGGRRRRRRRHQSISEIRQGGE